MIRQTQRDENGRCFMIFVDYLPEAVTSNWLWKAFSNCGMVVDSFIPRKRRQVSNSKHGFVRFKFYSDALKAVRNYNGIWWLEKRIVVKKANFFSSGRKVWRRKFQPYKDNNDNDSNTDY